MAEKGHRGGIRGMESAARGMQGGLAPGAINAGGGPPHFGLEREKDAAADGEASKDGGV